MKTRGPPIQSIKIVPVTSTQAHNIFPKEGNIDGVPVDPDSLSSIFQY
jgi:hypothetical protein